MHCRFTLQHFANLSKLATNSDDAMFYYTLAWVKSGSDRPKYLPNLGVELSLKHGWDICELENDLAKIKSDVSDKFVYTKNHISMLIVRAVLE